jgi:hypothetical protein
MGGRERVSKRVNKSREKAKGERDREVSYGGGGASDGHYITAIELLILDSSHDSAQYINSTRSIGKNVIKITRYHLHRSA